MVSLAELAVYGAVASGNDAVQPFYVGPAFKLQPVLFSDKKLLEKRLILLLKNFMQK